MDAALRSMLLPFRHTPLLVLACLFSLSSCSAPNNPNDQQGTLSDPATEVVVYGLYPNPWQDSTVLAFKLLNTQARSLRCTMYNAAGEAIQSYGFDPAKDSTSQTFIGSHGSPLEGFYECIWRGEADSVQVPNGVYYVELEVFFDDHSVVHRSLCMRRK